MDITTEKLKLIELILHTNNQSTIEKIKSIFRTEDAQDIWDELSVSQQKEIESALEEIRNGQTIPLETFLKKHK